ncbi:LuxR family transcriptional regulator [Massilia sp. YIM B02443]|uniref:LuxR family transcriptional regulator n=1 Tax=Massilia sp. YIM B02443 TaxID=3050127 RepID=UPI0025B700E9|nr:LuxR family transcriptional regulator [Massilia sp. YIM B02443]MDN4039613.1 LuxR family transcriptional regulator [Massilia sp. YIM B02443]
MIDTALLVELMQAKDSSEWSDSLYTLARKLGFDRVLYGVVASRDAPFESAFLRSNYSESWRERYDRNGFAYVDPTVTHSLSSSLPLVWEPGAFASSQQQTLYEEARMHGLRSGVTLPVHGPQGEFGVLSFASDARPDAEARRAAAAALPALTLVRDYALASSARFRDALLNPQPPRPLHQHHHQQHPYHQPHVPQHQIDAQRAALPRLTRRELEVLQWVMAGKSSWEIARITSCSEATVNFHLANVRQKFDVNTRQQAVVKAIALGLLTPEDHHR